MDGNADVSSHLPVERRGLEFDNFIGFDIYSENQTTKYTSGTMFHWLGAIGSNLTQIKNDQGPVADVLHGFEGRARGIGPIVLYVAKVDQPQIAVQLRWVNEFEVTNLLKGNILMLGVTFKLN